MKDFYVGQIISIATGIPEHQEGRVICVPEWSNGKFAILETLDHENWGWDGVCIWPVSKDEKVEWCILI
jgi:hypothetical protein